MSLEVRFTGVPHRTHKAALTPPEARVRVGCVAPSSASQTPVSAAAQSPTSMSFFGSSQPASSTASSKMSDNYSSTSTPNRNLLSADVEIKGSIKFTNDLTIDGKVEGEITSQGTLTVGENAEIRGEIKTKSATVHGRVIGNITVEERCELKARAVLHGDLKATRLVIEEGATFIGKSEVSPNKVTAMKQDAPRPAEPAKVAAVTTR